MCGLLEVLALAEGVCCRPATILLKGDTIIYGLVLDGGVVEALGDVAAATRRMEVGRVVDKKG
jgi:hypothetical protein